MHHEYIDFLFIMTEEWWINNHNKMVFIVIKSKKDQRSPPFLIKLQAATSIARHMHPLSIKIAELNTFLLFNCFLKVHFFFFCHCCNFPNFENYPWLSQTVHDCRKLSNDWKIIGQFLFSGLADFYYDYNIFGLAEGSNFLSPIHHPPHAHLWY